MELAVGEYDEPPTDVAVVHWTLGGPIFLNTELLILPTSGLMSVLSCRTVNRIAAFKKRLRKRWPERCGK